MFFYIIAGVIFFASFAMMVQLGVWNNLVNFIAIIIGGIVAFGVHQPLVVLIDQKTEGAYTYLLDFPVIWITFALVVGVLKLVAGFLSKTRVNFPDQVDNFGGAAVGFVAAYAMMCFAMSTFHAAPLGYDVLSNAYEYGVSPDEAKRNIDDKFAPLSPAVAWLRLCDSVLSPNAFGWSDGDSSMYFDSSIFVSQHGAHRKAYEAIDSAAVKRG